MNTIINHYRVRSGKHEVFALFLDYLQNTEHALRIQFWMQGCTNPKEVCIQLREYVGFTSAFMHWARFEVRKPLDSQSISRYYRLIKAEIERIAAL